MSLDEHARGIIKPGDCGTVFHVDTHKDFDVVYVTWDNHSGRLKNYTQFDVNNRSAWSVYSFELAPAGDDEMAPFDMESLFA